MRARLAVPVIVAFLMLLAVAAVSAPAAGAASLPSTETVSLTRSLNYTVLEYSPATSVGVKEEPTYAYFEFTKSYEMAAGAEQLILWSVAAPNHTIIEKFVVEVNDTSVPYSVLIYENNRTTDTPTTTFELTNIIGSHALLDLTSHRVNSLFFNISIRNDDAAKPVNATVTVKIAFTQFVFEDLKVVYADSSYEVRDIVVLPAAYDSTGGVLPNSITLLAGHEFKLSYDGQWADINATTDVQGIFDEEGATVGWTYEGTELYREATRITSDADAANPTLTSGQEYTAKTVYGVMVDAAPGSIIDFSDISSHAKVRFEDVDSAMEMAIDWPAEEVSYELDVPSLFESPESGYYVTTIQMDGALGTNFDFVALVSGWLSEALCDPAECYVKVDSVATTEGTLKWDDAMTVDLLDYSTLDESKTDLGGRILAGDEIAFSDSAEVYSIDAVYVRLYDSAGALAFSENRLGSLDANKVVFKGVPAGEYTRRIILERKLLAHAAVEDQADVVSHITVTKIETSPYETAEKIVIPETWYKGEKVFEGATVEEGASVTLELGPGTYYPRTENGALNWTVKIHSALPDYYTVTLALYHGELPEVGGGVDVFWTYSSGTPASDPSLPKKAFTLDLGGPAAVFIQGSPLVVRLDSKTIQPETAKFENYTGVKVLVGEAGTLTVKYPAKVVVTVLDKNGKPVEGATVNLAQAATTYAALEYKTTTNSSGIAVFENVEPSTTDYVLTVVYHGYIGSTSLPVRDDVTVTVKMDFAIEEVTPTVTTTTTAPPVPWAPPAEYTIPILLAILVIAVIILAVAVARAPKAGGRAGEAEVTFEL